MKREGRLSLGQGQLMLWILAGSVLAVVAMLAFFRVSGLRHAPFSHEVPRIEWMPAVHSVQPSSNDERYVIADVLDPSLMSLPSRHGFSREVWERKGEATQRSLGWNEQPAYLKVTLPDAPPSLLEPVPLDSAALLAAEKSPAQPEESDDEIIQSTPPVNQSAVHMLGSLGNRGIVRLPELPVISNSVSLRPSQVRVGVDGGGLVQYASLDRSCGSEAVDAEAVALAQQLRFEPEPTALTWGIVRFLWATQAPASTNVASDATQSQ